MDGNKTVDIRVCGRSVEQSKHQGGNARLVDTIQLWPNPSVSQRLDNAGNPTSLSIRPPSPYVSTPTYGITLYLSTNWTLVAFL